VRSCGHNKVGNLSDQDDEVAENDAAHQDTERGDFDIAK
jgi:hypothetical protein